MSLDQKESIIILCEPCFVKKNELRNILFPTFLSIGDICDECKKRIEVGDPVIRYVKREGAI